MVTLKEKGLQAEKTSVAGPKITLFHCVQALSDAELLERDKAQLNGVKLACTSMVKDIYLLKAFEAGADAVIVLACPEGQCRYVEGNLRARKRVDRVKKLLDEIGWGGERLSFFNISRGDQDAAAKIVEDTAKHLSDLSGERREP